MVTMIQCLNDWFFLRARQNELSPNHANETVKHAARIRRPGPAARPAWYLVYSRSPASAPTPESARKVNPVTSSQS